MTRKVLLALTAATAAFATPALAQSGDRPFSGIYVGGSIGYDVQPNDVGSSILFDRNRDGTFGDTVTTVSGANAFSTGFCNGAARGTTSTPGCDNDDDGVSYYARVGADHQFANNIVIGVVGEFGKSDVSDSVTAFSITPASYTFTREIDYNASVRGRLGYAVQNTLFYGAFGGAYAKIGNDFSTTNTANSFTLNDSDDAWGITAGGGIEQKIGNNLSIGLEYMFNQYYDDETRVRVGQGTAPTTNPFLLAGTAGTDFRRSDDKFRWHSLRATAAFRF